MRGSRNFRQGGGGGDPGQSDKKRSDISDNVFLVLGLFYKGQINFKEFYRFSRFQRGSNIFPGGPTFSRGGGPIAYSLYKPILLVIFQGGGGPDPLPAPSGSALSCQRNIDHGHGSITFRTFRLGDVLIPSHRSY